MRNAIRINDGEVYAICSMCETGTEIPMTVAQEAQWRGPGPNNHIQDVAPELSASLRELLISGTCPKCWDRLFGAEEVIDETDT